MVPGAYPSAAAQTIHYRVLLEPLGSNVFFVAQHPLWLQGGYRMITSDAGGALYSIDREHPVGMYEAGSDIKRPSRYDLLYPGKSAERAGTTNVSPAENALLQLPKMDPRIQQLAQQITANSASDYDRAAEIELYLRTHYSHTLDLGRVVPKDPVSYFLFERKQGHCEYFASAMAVMLRALGIPARVVNGFRGGVFNDITSQYVVRMRNAHSWVESYFPGYGWISFDPTPAADPSQRGQPSRIMLYIDAASSFWREWVINYDFQHQKLLGQKATNSSRQVFERTRDRWQQHYDALLALVRQLRRAMVLAPRTWASAGIGLVVLLLLGLNARILRSTINTLRLAAHPERAPQKAAGIWYQRMTRTIARRGWRKLSTQTPTEFAKSIDDRKLQEAVTEFTERYEKARFANSSEDAKHLPELYEAISTRRRS
jgi:transglutaminase-like putative cysteine protease